RRGRRPVEAAAAGAARARAGEPPPPWPADRLHQRLLRRAARRARGVPAGSPPPGRRAGRRRQQRRRRARPKGAARPVDGVADRVAVLAGLSAVDYLTVFDGPTPLESIRLVRPDVLVKGADYRAGEVVGGDFVRSYGGRVHLAALREGLSTTGILERLEAA